jgi:hypothetical protein
MIEWMTEPTRTPGGVYATTDDQLSTTLHKQGLLMKCPQHSPHGLPIKTYLGVSCRIVTQYASVTHGDTKVKWEVAFRRGHQG